MPFLDNDGVTRLTTDYLDIFAPKEELGEGDGTNAGPIYELSAKGHAEQVSTTGKNLLDESILTNALEWKYASVQLLPNTTYIGSSPDAPNSYVDSTAPSLYMMDDLTSADRMNVVNSSHQSIITTNETGIVKVQWRNKSSTDNLTNYHFQLELGSTATEYEPYSGGAPSPSPSFPQEIQVVRGRNLLDKSKNTPSKNFNSGGELVNKGAWWQASDYIEVEAGASYTTSGMVSVSDDAYYCWYTNAKAFISSVSYNAAKNKTITAPSNARYLRISYETDDTQYQLTLGSTPQPYVPYGHVGMEVRDANDQLLSTTPIPLPSKGWAGGLPDGTADSLRLDGAGHVEWTLADAETTTAATDGVTGTIGVDVLSTTGQIADGATVLYKLATPVTEECGYVEDWPIDISEGATISIPELDALNVKYFIANDSISQYANQWYERTKAVDIADVEDAVGDLASVTANLVTHDQFYVGYDEVNGKKMISIFKRGDI